MRAQWPAVALDDSGVGKLRRRKACRSPYPSGPAFDGTALPPAPPLEERPALIAYFAVTSGLYNVGAEPIRQRLAEASHELIGGGETLDCA